MLLDWPAASPRSLAVAVGLKCFLFLVFCVWFLFVVDFLILGYSRLTWRILNHLQWAGPGQQEAVQPARSISLIGPAAGCSVNNNISIRFLTLEGCRVVPTAYESMIGVGRDRELDFFKIKALFKIFFFKIALASREYFVL